MRILSVTAQKPDSTGSGVYLTELVKGFDKLGHTQAVIAGITMEDTIILPSSVTCYPVFYNSEQLPFPVAGMSDEMPYESTRYCDMTEKMTKQLTEVFTKRVLSVVEEFQPDIILCHHLYYLTSLIRSLCPMHRVYAVCHGSDMRQVKKNVWQRDFIRNYIPKLNGIFSLHEEQKKEICEYYGCSDEHVTVIGTGYNNSIFFRQGKKEASEELRLIFAGKISEKKGVKSLIKSMQYLKDRKILLQLAGGAGNQKEYAEIKELAEQCPCKVEFLGKLSQQDLAVRTNSSDVFVLPSFYEGLPLVIIEAMACGAKVVCTDLPGIQPWIDKALPEHGVVFVEPPLMQNQDEPVEATLPDFERRLAEAILRAGQSESVKSEVLQKISWDGLCERLQNMW